MINKPDSPSSEDVFDLLIIGGGVMGLFTAYHASESGRRVAVLERGRVGDPATASFGRTRSYRRDYLDPTYARLADEAIGLWTSFERATGANALVRCGCLNIAKASVTPDLAGTYATLTTDVLRQLGMPVHSLAPDEVTQRYPYLRTDVADLDEAGGLVDLGTVTAALLAALYEAKASLHEYISVKSITPAEDLIRVTTDLGEFVTRSLAITAGHGSNDVLALIPGCTLQIPITKDRPSDAKYFTPPPAHRHQFTSDVMPVIAYLDTGIYLHPIVDGLIDAVKIGYYNPPDLPQDRTGITSISDFIDQCLPGLANAQITDVTDVDTCDYDLVADDDFVLGPVPGHPNIVLGVGWRGTGYKFAPWIGRTLHQLATQHGTVYDIHQFDPARFIAETPAAQGESS